MTNENWIKTESLKEYKNQAKKKVIQHDKYVEGKRQVTIPHPTIPKTFILKYI